MGIPLKLTLAAVGAGAAAGVAAYTGRRKAYDTFADDARRKLGEATSRRTLVKLIDLVDLPDPVADWMTAACVLGRLPIRSVHLRQHGRLRSANERPWTEFDAEQYTIAEPPTFLWIATAHLAGLPLVLAYDRLVDGHGGMDLSLGGRIPLDSSSGPEVDESTLHRYIAEMTSIPSAALSEHVTWRPVDSSSARATVSLDGVSANATFHFGEDGLPARVSAERYRSVPHGFVRTPWTAELFDYRDDDGFVTPHRATSTWHLADGDLTAIEIETTGVEFDIPHFTQ